MKFKKIEIALIIGLVCSFTTMFAAVAQDANPNDKLIRLHVIAQSDSPEDQALKLKVRDAVLEFAQPILQDCTTMDNAHKLLEQNSQAIYNAAQQCISQNGYSYDVTVKLEKVPFPTREYDGFSLPAGQYTALRIIIGEGKGKNWWCVVFPPLCAAAATETLEQAALTAGLSEQEIQLITQQDGEYVLKFKCLEWIENIRQKLKK